MPQVAFRLRVFLALLIGVLFTGALGFVLVENLSFVDAFYFTIVTVATVGYGDIHPLTIPGKVIAVLLIMTGVGTFLGVVANGTEMVLTRRENQQRQRKLNLVIGLFLSELGSELISLFSRCDPEVESLRSILVVKPQWTKKDFASALCRLSNYSYNVAPQLTDLRSLRDLLLKNRDLILRLLEHPVLLEHEAFTEMLTAVFHLKEELFCRDNLAVLPQSDLEHLAGDTSRAYRLVLPIWLSYMEHLIAEYPYLFSLAIRTNPFDVSASPVVT